MSLQPAPSVWDATKDAGEYRVGFFFFAGGGGINPNRLTVKLAPVPWEKVGQIVPGYRQLNPLGYSDFVSLGKWLVIPISRSRTCLILGADTYNRWGRLTSWPVG